MPNYLHPEAALAWERRELAGLPLAEDLREALEIQLAHWARQNEDSVTKRTPPPAHALVTAVSVCARSRRVRASSRRPLAKRLGQG